MGISGAYNVTTNDWTISGWIKTHHWPLGHLCQRLERHRHPNDPDLPGGMDHLWNEGTTPRARLTVDNDINRYDLFSPDFSVTNDGTWHHLAAVTKASNIYLYLDGALWTSRQWCPDTI